ncbi:MAG: tRNA pseudouridine synthase A [Planctomycetota bacterium]
MPRYKLIVAYEGTDFCGWQKQEPLAINIAGEPREATQPADTREIGDGRDTRETLEGRPGRIALRTVQHVLERAVREVVREPILLLGASRTDSGVHARGQVAAFTCGGDEPSGDAVPPTDAPQVRGLGWPVRRGVTNLVRAINGRLPEDCLVVGAEHVPHSFDPISDCTSKGYSYTIHAARERTLFERRLVHHVWEPLDVGAMADAAACFVGEHDFGAFAAAGHGRMSTVRRVLSCGVTRTGPDRVRIEISGTGFLWNMVRIVAGTLTEVGRGRIAPAAIPKIIAGADRRHAGPTFPARGLCLEWVSYDQPTPENARERTP